MMIESLIRRANGTQVTLGGVKYHFAPDSNGLHVANVENQDHMAKFLAVPTGYRLVLDSGLESQNRVSVVTPAALYGPQNVDPATDTKVPEGDKSPEGQEQSQESDETSGLDKHGRSQELIEQFTAKFGRQPHYSWSDERIQAELSEA